MINEKGVLCYIWGPLHGRTKQAGPTKGGIHFRSTPHSTSKAFKNSSSNCQYAKGAPFVVQIRRWRVSPPIPSAVGTKVSWSPSESLFKLLLSKIETLRWEWITNVDPASFARFAVRRTFPRRAKGRSFGESDHAIPAARDRMATPSCSFVESGQWMKFILQSSFGSWVTRKANDRTKQDYLPD